MKKLIALLGVVGLGLTLHAQNFESQSFLTVRSIAVTNTLCVTNLNSPINTYGTNNVGTIWTNLAGTRVVSGTVSATNPITGAITYQGSGANLLRSIDLPPNRLGSYPPLQFATISGTIDTLVSWVPSPFNLNIRLVGQSGANSAVTFVFAPVCDGTNESGATADLFKVAVTANTTTAVTLNTNLPAYLWMGCKSLRLREVINADTDASSRVDVLGVTLNSWIP